MRPAMVRKDGCIANNRLATTTEWREQSSRNRLHGHFSSTSRRSIQFRRRLLICGELESGKKTRKGTWTPLPHADAYSGKWMGVRFLSSLSIKNQRVRRTKWYFKGQQKQTNAWNDGKNKWKLETYTKTSGSLLPKNSGHAKAWDK